jgi:hypothetical protein
MGFGEGRQIHPHSERLFCDDEQCAEVAPLRVGVWRIAHKALDGAPDVFSDVSWLKVFDVICVSCGGRVTALLAQLRVSASMKE